MGQPTLPLEFDYTPLHFAATYGHLELARVLLAHGADVDDATPGETPLDRAVIMHDVPMATLLLEHGANADHPSAAGLTALHRAAIRGRTEIVGLLLAHRANRLIRVRRAQRYGNLLAPGHKQACRPDIEAIVSKRNDVNVSRVEFASRRRLPELRGWP
jgi:ankyrin repeat protein